MSCITHVYKEALFVKVWVVMSGVYRISGGNLRRTRQGVTVYGDDVQKASTVSHSTARCCTEMGTR